MNSAPGKAVGKPITGHTRFYGIFADPIAHVKAPAAFNAILRDRSVDAVFVPFHVAPEKFEQAVAGLRVLRNFDGFTLTIPHKTRAAKLCDHLEPIARACGAVNAVRRQQDGTLIGETFDGIGMAHALASITRLQDTRVLLVGAGGAASAIAFALAQAGVSQLRIKNRTPAAAERLARAVSTAFRNLDASVAEAPLKNYDILINATSLGLNGHGDIPFDPAETADHAIIADAVMEPEFTPLIARARALSRAIVPGRRMLEEQLSAMADFLWMREAT